MFAIVYLTTEETHELEEKLQLHAERRGFQHSRPISIAYDPRRLATHTLTSPSIEVDSRGVIAILVELS